MKLRLVTDRELIEAVGGRRVTSAKDVSLMTDDILGCGGGVYDPLIFGGLKQCKCLSFRQEGVCPQCGTRVYMDPKDYMKRAAYYKLNCPVVYPYKIGPLFAKLKDLGMPYDRQSRGAMQDDVKLQNIWSSVWDVKYVSTLEAADLIGEGGEYYKLIIKGDIEPTDTLDKIGLFGIMNLYKYKDKDGNLLSDLSLYINTVLVVDSPYFRPYSVRRQRGHRVVEIPEETQNYKAIITYSEKIQDLTSNFYDGSVDQATIAYNFGILVMAVLNRSELLRASKQSLIRSSVGVRVTRSGRANLVPDHKLTMDQVKIPRGLAYEALNADIVHDLVRKGATEVEAQDLYLKGDVKANESFLEIVKNSQCILLRNPTLHKICA